MRAVLLTGHGGIDKLVYRDDVKVPAPGPRQVLINVTACGMNNTDINTRTGWYAPTVKSALTSEIALGGVVTQQEASTWDRSEIQFPKIQGADAVGRIVAVGPGVPETRIGERVITDPCIRDPKLPINSQGVTYFGSECNGGYAEYTVIASDNARVVRSDLTDVELASFACSYSTAEEMLTRIGLTMGETILVTGASGGVGSANIQLAKRRGARVIAIASKDKERQLIALGTDHFIPRETESLAGAIHELTGERGIDCVADVVGGKSLVDMLRVLRRAGRYVSAGAIAGPCPEIDMRDLIYKDLEMYGVGNPRYQTFSKLLGYIEKGEIKPLIARTYNLRDFRLAQEEFIRKGHVGKIVIRVAE
jgi:NADPH:quinone reductase-like Zn-dependent oxidoreductase